MQVREAIEQPKCYVSYETRCKYTKIFQNHHEKGQKLSVSFQIFLNYFGISWGFDYYASELVFVHQKCDADEKSNN